MENLFTKALEKTKPGLVEVVKRRNAEKQDQIKRDIQEKENHDKWLERKRLENKTKELNVSRKNKIKDMLKTLNGLPPYDSCSNICYLDGYYSQSIPGKPGNKEYDVAMEELIKEFGPEKNWDRFMDKELKW